MNLSRSDEPAPGPRPTLPTFIEMETASVCNWACPWCPTGVPNLREAPRVMRWETFTKVVGDLAAERWSGEIALHNFNEPLLHHRIHDEYLYLAEALPGATSALYSNGDRLTRDSFERLRADGIRRFRITRYPAIEDVERSAPRVPREHELLAWLEGVTNTSVGTTDFWRSGRETCLLYVESGLEVEIYAPSVIDRFTDRVPRFALAASTTSSDTSRAQ